MDAYYEEVWENPRDCRNVVFEALNRYVESRVPSGWGKKALDVGAGKGTITRMLLKKGYDVTVLDTNKAFVDDLVTTLHLQGIVGSISKVKLREDYDLITCIEVLQNLTREEAQKAMMNMMMHTDKLFVNISNRNSFHGRYVKARGWQLPFVHTYVPSELESMLSPWFKVTHRRGIGLVTPVSLFKEFKVVLIPKRAATFINRLDNYALKHCHLYYVEAEPALSLSYGKWLWNIILPTLKAALKILYEKKEGNGLK